MPDRVLTAAGNMEADAAMIAATAAPGGPERWSRVFQWRGPAVSLPRNGIAGLDESVLPGFGVEGVRRPTGGGALIHGSDVSFSAAMRSPRGRVLDLVEAGRALAGPVRAALEMLGFAASFRDRTECTGSCVHSPVCFLQRTPFDLVVAGRKVAAFALRRTGSVLFIHGSVLVTNPPEVAVRALVSGGLPEAARWGDGVVSLAGLGGRVGIAEVLSGIAKSNGWPVFVPPPPLAEVPAA